MLKIGDWLVTWVVEVTDDNEEVTCVARYYDPVKAAEYAMSHSDCCVRMEVVKPEWNVATQD